MNAGRFYFEVEYYKYLQFKFDEQWRRLKAYANSKGIRIIGDIPIYVALDSADAWANPGLFQLDKKNLPTALADEKDPADKEAPKGDLPADHPLRPDEPGVTAGILSAQKAPGPSRQEKSPELLFFISKCFPERAAAARRIIE